MPTTPNYALRYPLEADTADIPRDMGYLAGDTDGALHTHAAAATIDHPDGSVTTAKLAAGAASHAGFNSSISDQTNATNTFVDTAVAVPITLVGTVCECWASFTGQNDTPADAWEARLRMDTGETSDIYACQGVQDTRAILWQFNGITPGARTVTLQIRNAGAGTARILGSQVALLVQERKR